MKNVAILQARMSSSRLPGKVMIPINDRPMIHWQIQRILNASKITELVVATSNHESDDILANYLSELQIEVVRGSLENVSDRFNQSLINRDADYFLRLTGDCPIIMPEIIDEMITEFESDPTDYFSNTLELTFPDGLDVEIISRSAFQSLSKINQTDQEREHVTLGLYSRPHEFSLSNFRSPINLGNRRWTVDTLEDMEFIKLVFQYFKGRETTFNLKDMLLAEELTPEFRRIVPR